MNVGMKSLLVKAELFGGLVIEKLRTIDVDPLAVTLIYELQLLFGGIYKIILDDSDTKSLEKFNAQVEAIATTVERVLNGGEVRSDEEKVLLTKAECALGKNRSKEAITLFAIATFLYKNKRWKDDSLATLKVFMGGTHHVTSFGKDGTQLDTCVDVAALTHVLAGMHSISGEIDSDLARHYFWISANNHAIDVYNGPKESNGLTLNMKR